MIERPRLQSEIQTALRRNPVVTIVGPRQCGKTTLARQIVPVDSTNYFDLEDPTSRARLAEPMTALRPLRGIVVIDEIQREPTLFAILRVLADRDPLPARFLILGGASPGLVRQTSESLAGRTETITLAGFSVEELGSAAISTHWLRGGFPRSYLAETGQDSAAWRRNFVQTFLERDIPQLGLSLPSVSLLRFWTMVAHCHGGIWNATEPARSLGISESTVRRYLDLFSGLFMVRQLQPWHQNLKKRQVRSPKVYVRDSGLLHTLLGIHTESNLLSHPKLGASWEGYSVEEALKSVLPDEAYFWSTYQGAELDLLLLKDGRRYGVEVKRQDAPRITPSMRIVIEDLELERLSVIYPGERSYELSERVRVVPLADLAHGPSWLTDVTEP